MKHCPNCGGEIGDEAKFCTWCGSAIAVAAAPVVAAAAVSDPTPKPVTTAVPVQTGYTQGSYTQPTYTQPQTYAQGSYTQPQQTSYTQPTYYTQPTAQTTGTKKDGLGIAAIVFMGLAILINLYNAIGYSTIIGSDETAAAMAVMYGIMVVVSIILTILVVKKVKSKEKISTGFKVVTLIFGSLITGILLFVRKEDQL